MSQDKKIAAFLLRGGAAAAKLLLIAYLVRQGEVSLVGELAIIYAVVNIFVQLSGFEIYQTICREVHSPNKVRYQKLIDLQVYISITAYLFMAPVVWVYLNGRLEYNFFLLLPVLVLEHFATEQYRLNVAKLLPLRASSILFAKNAMWMGVFVPLHAANMIAPNLTTILSIWLASLLGLTLFLLFCTSSVGLFCVRLKGYFVPSLWVGEVNSIMRQSSGFIVSGVVMACVASVDKIFAAYFFEKEIIGMFFFFQSLASIPALIINFSVGATLWPLCVKLKAEAKLAEYEAALRRLKILYLLLFVGVGVSVAIVWMVASEYVGNASLKEYSCILYILLFFSFFFSMTEPLKLELYAEKMDKALSKSNLLQGVLIIGCMILGGVTENIFLFSLFIAFGGFFGYIFYKRV